jgi:hypothetical protein
MIFAKKQRFDVFRAWPIFIIGMCCVGKTEKTNE